jgi:hypothetical protein
MNALLDDLIVGAILLASFSYAAAKLGPKLWRKRILETLSQALRAAPKFLGLGRAAQRLEAASGKAQGACGGYDNCGSESAAPQSSAAQSSPTQSSAQIKAPAEIRVPVAKIGRRA